MPSRIIWVFIGGKKGEFVDRWIYETEEEARKYRRPGYRKHPTKARITWIEPKKEKKE